MAAVAIVVLIAISVDKAIDSLDSMLIPCQHGTTYSNGACFCQGTPFIGPYCGTCNCTTGYCVIGGTTPRITSDYGCKCPQGSKFFGFMCDQCHTENKTYVETTTYPPVPKITECFGTCEEGFFGSRCERKCFPDVSYIDTLSLDATGDDGVCRGLRMNGGLCNPCSGHGTCKDGFCQCEKNYYNDGPSQCAITCPPASNGKICSGRGLCKLFGSTPSCLCESGWRGSDCSIACPGIEEGARACHGHGACMMDYEVEPTLPYCVCQDKYRGDSCQIECPGEYDEPCSGHGSCMVEDGKASCICQVGMLDWVGPACNCTDILSCNSRGTCVSDLTSDKVGQCACEGNYDGPSCAICKPNYYGSTCQMYCDSDADHDDDPNKLGCHGRGVCTVFGLDTIYESMICECDRNEIQKRVKGKLINYFSSFSPEINCKDCFHGYFPKMNIFETYDTTELGLHVPCQIQCTEITCNGEGICNELYGKAGESLCLCDTGPNNNKFLNESSFCTKCDTNWFPDKPRDPEGCSNFCVSDIAELGGNFPAVCEQGDIDCVHCNGQGTCNADGQCDCTDGFTGDFCQIQCTSDSGIICGGHGVCETTDLQNLLQFELEYIEDSGPAYTCTCDPQDPYSKEARLRYAETGEEGQLDPPPNASFFGETCDYHCINPPWRGSEECNDMGNCTMYAIQDPRDNTFECHKDSDCEGTNVMRIISGDISWHDAKGPFCHKVEYPEGCEDDTYHIDDCVNILTLQRPPQARAKMCVEDTLCRHTLETYDWHQWCTNVEEVASPPIFQSCGEVSQFCPVQVIDSKCTDYVSLSTGTDISAHMDFCYENDKKRYPFQQTTDYRLGDISAEYHDMIDDEMVRYHNEFPEVSIDIAPYCTEHIKKFDTQITEVGINRRYTCGSDVVSDDSCIYGAQPLDQYFPFTVNCPNLDPVTYATYNEAEVNRGMNCYITEDSPRHVVANSGFVKYGGVCYSDADCNIGSCKGNTCCNSVFDFTNCKSCNNIGQCAQCKEGTAWDGIRCEGTSTEPEITYLSGSEQKEGLDMIDDTCASAINTFPVCTEPTNACDISACKDGDTCTPDGLDGICKTTGVLDCSCKYGLECVPISFTKYKCVGEFESSSCPSEYQNFNWVGYCSDNNPVLKVDNFGDNVLTENNPSNYVLSLSGSEQNTEYIRYWVKPTTIFSSSKYVEVTHNQDAVARVYLHQGQIQLNRIQSLESCPSDNPTCQLDWGYTPNRWYHLEIKIDYVNKVVTLNNLDKPDLQLVDTFPCLEDGCTAITSINEFTINGDTETFYDEIIFEKSMPKPSLFDTCNQYSYCDMNVDYRDKCSDILRNLKYPLLLSPSHDIIDTCKNFFEYQSFDTYSLSNPEQDAIELLDWDTYCLFSDSISGDYNCDGNPFTYLENYNNCRDLLDPLDGSKQCMVDALGYNWDTYCEDLVLAAIPTDIKDSCPKPCYKHFKDYTDCDHRLELFDNNHHLKDSACPGDWVDFCKEVAMDKHKGICSAITCDCDINKYEGVSGNSCELHCPLASDGSACGEETGVGKCVYTEKDQATYDAGTLDAAGNWIAWEEGQMEITGECNCFLSEGKYNCDQECLNCNEEAYNRITISPADQNQWSGEGITNIENMHIGASSPAQISEGGYVILDMQEDDMISDIDIEGGVRKYLVSVSMDNDFYEDLKCDGNIDGFCVVEDSMRTTNRVNGFGRFVKISLLEGSGFIQLGVMITRSGQVGKCNGGTGACDCLPPFTGIVEEKYVNWRGLMRKKLNRVYSMPEQYNAEEEFRIRAMQGKEVFVKEFLKKSDGTLAYDADTYPFWRTLYDDFRDHPEDYLCMPDRNCHHHDFILLGNLDSSSYRYNYDCNTECEGIDPGTLIPCNGHGSCAVTGVCQCDPAAIVKGTNEVTGYSIVFNFGDGESMEESEYQISKYDRTGWRGSSCDVMCPGYDPVTKSMLKVCNGKGVCNDDAECECELGYTGEYCQFTCPGFEDGEENVCSGHGTCTMNLIEIIAEPIVVAYDGYCSDWKYALHLSYNTYSAGSPEQYYYDKTPLACLTWCAGHTWHPNAGFDQEYKAASIRHSDNACFCSPVVCSGEIRGTGLHTTYKMIGQGGVVSPIDCTGDWTEWSDCDGERQTRYFTVSQLPLYGGQECPVTPEFRTCFLPNTDCDGTWSDWSECSYDVVTSGQPDASLNEDECEQYASEHGYNWLGKSDEMTLATNWQCGNGYRTCFGSHQQYSWGNCQANCIQVDSPSGCSYQPETNKMWYNTFETTVECGVAAPAHLQGYTYQVNCIQKPTFETRHFTTTQEPIRYGLVCPLTPEKRICSLPVINCEGTWSSFTTCDTTTLTQERTFTVSTQPENNGLACPESPHIIDCSEDQVNCEYTDNGWGECNQGQQTKTYSIVTQPALGGMPCPSDETRSCTTCTDNSKCASGSCKGGQCCNSNFALCDKCDNGGYCMKCIEHATTQLNGNCQCDDRYVYDSGECKLTWTVIKEPIYNSLTGWGPWKSCTSVDGTGIQSRVRSKDTTLVITNSGDKHFVIDSILDPHFKIEMQMMDTLDGTTPEIASYTAKVTLDMNTPDFPARIVSEFDCPSCSSGTWDVEPVSTVINADGTLVGDIEFGEGSVEWTPSNLKVSSDVIHHVTVTVVNHEFIFVPPLDVIEVNKHYEFDLSDPSNANHSLAFGFTENINHGCTHEGTEGYTGAKLIFKPIVFTTHEILSFCDICDTQTYRYGKVSSHGIYYLITPQSPLMITKFTVEETFTGDSYAYEERACAVARRRLLAPHNNLCKHDADCDSKTCLQGRCCHKKYQGCESCNKLGKCSRCSKDMHIVNETCTPVDCNKKYGFKSRYVHDKGCVRVLGTSYACTSDSDCGADTNGRCLNGVCCNINYEDVNNCIKCNSGEDVWDYQAYDGYIDGGPDAELYCSDYSIHCPFLKEQYGCDDPRLGACKATCNTCPEGISPNINIVNGLGYSKAIETCDENTECKGIYHTSNTNEFFLRTNNNIISSPDHNAYKKIYKEDQYCAICLEGSIYMNSRKKCVKQPCPVGQEWVDNQGCITKEGEADDKMQVPVQTALANAYCSDGFYRDRESNECLPFSLTPKPIIDVTLYIDQGTSDEIFMTFGCEVWGVNVVKCPLCNCFKDYIYGKWTSFECETCLKGYGQKQCRKECPGFDGTNEISMCNAFGSCSFGSVTADLKMKTSGDPDLSVTKEQCEKYALKNDIYFSELVIDGNEIPPGLAEAVPAGCLASVNLNIIGQTIQGIYWMLHNDAGTPCGTNDHQCLIPTDERSFQDATCTCGNPPGSVNEAGNQMQIYNTFYTELTTITETNKMVACHNEAVLESDLKDTCYHFDSNFADCSTCQDDFSGFNCQYRCEKCLMGGRCDSTPSDKRSSVCECVELFGIAAGLWSFNCCPVGWIVTDIHNFNSYRQETNPDDPTALVIDDMVLNTVYAPDKYVDTYFIDTSSRPQDTSVTLEMCHEYRLQQHPVPELIEFTYDYNDMPGNPATGCILPVPNPYNHIYWVKDASDHGRLNAAPCNFFNENAADPQHNNHWNCVKFRPGMEPDLAVRNADYWCKPCPGVDTRTDGGSWLNPQAQYQVCGGVARGSCYRKNYTHNGCECMVGNGGDPNDLTKDWVGMACTCNAKYWKPYETLLKDYGCNNQGTCLDDVVNINGVNIACAPNEGYYTKLVELLDEQGQPTNTYENVITPAAIGHMVPFNGQLFTSDNSPEGEECFGGHVVDGVICQRCNNGYYQDLPAQSSCKKCPAGWMTPNYWHLVYTECYECPVGRFATKVKGSENTNEKFPTFDWKEYFGTEVHETANFCARCPRGSYQDEAGQTSCKKCQKGRWNTALNHPHYDYIMETAGLPYYNLLVSGGDVCDIFWVNDNVCSNGHNSGKMMDDWIGDYETTQYQPIGTLGECNVCNAGQYIGEDEGGGAGIISNDLEQNGENGGWGAWQYQGPAYCLSCPAGKYSNVNTGIKLSECLDCIPGKYSSGAATSCTNCPPGKTQHLTAQGSCNDCPLGKYMGQSGSASDCLYCGSKVYQDQTGQSSCKSCPQGKYLTGSDAGATSVNVCKNCDSGRWGVGEGSNCGEACPGGHKCTGNGVKTACPKGKYAPSGSQYCYGCGSSSSSLTNRAYQDQTGQTTCKYARWCTVPGPVVNGKQCTNDCTELHTEDDYDSSFYHGEFKHANGVTPGEFMTGSNSVWNGQYTHAEYRKAFRFCRDAVPANWHNEAPSYGSACGCYRKIFIWLQKDGWGDAIYCYKWCGTLPTLGYYAFQTQGMCARSCDTTHCGNDGDGIHGDDKIFQCYEGNY